MLSRFGREGVSGCDARCFMRLQQALKNLGYYTGTVDGFYGEGTMSAVKAFQRVKGLNTDGKAGPATQRVLFEGDFPNEA